MTTRTGEPATKRESYTQYIQGRAAAVRWTPKRVSTALFPQFVSRAECYVPLVRNPRARPGEPRRSADFTPPHRTTGDARHRLRGP